MNCKKSLKIPKGQLESVYRRRTDNTMAKRKKDKRRSTKHTYKTITKTFTKMKYDYWFCSSIKKRFEDMDANVYFRHQRVY